MTRIKIYIVTGVWTHGDFCSISSSTGGIVMLGRRYVGVIKCLAESCSTTTLCIVSPAGVMN